MPFLDAALAFALTMLVIATVVTQIVRFLQARAGLRNGELQRMLEEYFEKELEPVVKREMSRLNAKVSTEVATEVSALAKKLTKSELFDKEELASKVEVSTAELIERLKRSDLGDNLLKGLADDAKEVFAEMGERYEVIGDKFTESFRKHSRRWTTAVALVLALIVNIDSIHIADSYIRNATLRANVVAQMNDILANVDAPVVAPDSMQNGNPMEDLSRDVADVRKQIGYLTGIGFPLGWDYFPHTGLQKTPSEDFENRNTISGWVMWSLGILFTSLLAGLGAPFWYDAVMGINRLAQRARTSRKPTT